TGKTVGAEALLRWDSPELGFVPPDKFIPQAEKTQLIHPVTLWVFKKSLESLSRWKISGITPTLSINISARNLHDKFFLHQLKLLLQDYTFDASFIEIEITESAIMDHFKRAVHFMEEVKSMGF